MPALAAAPSVPDNPLGCEAGRNAGRPQPPWWPRVRAIVVDNREFFPPGIDIPFLGAWIEHESDGKHDAGSSLGEVGYFQLHPAEIEDMVGADKVASAIAEIETSPIKSVQWGGALLAHYDEAIVKQGVPRGTSLYHGLLKVMHSSRPRGVAWLKHVRAVLGRNPTSFDEFVATAVALERGALRSPLSTALPSKLPSCAPGFLLARRDVFVTPADRIEAFQRQAGVHLATRNTAALFLATVGVLGDGPFPGVVFGSPIAGARVTSGWGRPRPSRNGTHEGIDIPVPIGTPVLAAADGTVLRIAEEEHAGRFVTVGHGAGWVSRYMHLDSALVQPGQTVRLGQIIALSGDTGVGSSGPHLHFDLKLAAERVADYVAAFGMPATGFGREGRDGIGVPAEPLIPVSSYAVVVIADARRNKIPLFSPPPAFPWGKTFAAAGGVALLLTLTATIATQPSLPARRKRRR